MNENDYISALQAQWPRDSDASLEIIAVADEAVRNCPSSARLYVMRGNLIELGPKSCPHSLEEALRSYQRAVEIDPQYADGWEEIGHYYDAILDDEKEAERLFQKAARLRGVTNSLIRKLLAYHSVRAVFACRKT